MSLLPYKNYKDSGVDWLGEVPAHWETIRLRWLFEIKKRISGELGYDVLSITQKGIKVKDTESNEGQLSMDYSKYQIVEIGDFAMNHMDLLTGYVDIASQVGVTSPDYRVFSIRNHRDCYDKFALYLFQIGYRNKIFYAYGQGSSQFGRWLLPTEQFNDLPFPLPPIKEQQTIADFLDHETAKIDALVAEQETLVALLDEKIDSLVLSSLDEGYTVRLRLNHVVDVISREVIQVEDIEYEPLGLFNRGRGVFHKYRREKSDMGDSDFYWIKEGDLIISGQFAWEGAVAMAYEEEEGCVVSHRYPVLRGKENVALTEYIFALLRTKHGDFLLNECSTGAAGRNKPLNLRLLLKEEIPLPDMQTQLIIAKLVKERSKIMKEVQHFTLCIKERRSALISAAITGKIDVRDFV